jgi:hypothetical protein
MESVYHIVAIRVNETSWAHVWRLHFCYLGMGYDTVQDEGSFKLKKQVALTAALTKEPDSTTEEVEFWQENMKRQ